MMNADAFTQGTSGCRVMGGYSHQMRHSKLYFPAGSMSADLYLQLQLNLIIYLACVLFSWLIMGLRARL